MSAWCSATVLWLPRDQRAALARSARASYPQEACGVLLGTREGDSHVVCRVTWQRNAAEDGSHRYVLDPLDFLRTADLARERGEDVIGIWHSHPDGCAAPSAADRLGAHPGWSYVIAATTAEGVHALRSWRLAGGRFAEERIEEGPCVGRARRGAR